MRLCVLYLVFLYSTHLPARALSSKKSVNKHNHVTGKRQRIADIGAEIKRKASSTKKVLAEATSDLGVDVDDAKSSISSKLADLKEKSGDLSYLVSCKLFDGFRGVLCYLFGIYAERPLQLSCRTSVCARLIEIRGGGRKARSHASPLPRRPLQESDIAEKEGQSLKWSHKVANMFCYYAGITVSIQILGSILSNNADEIADRLLSKESAMAVNTIREIIDNFSDHGVIDVFSLYPKREIIASILALSRLQKAALYGATQFEERASTGRSTIDFLSAALRLPSSFDYEKEQDMDDARNGEISRNGTKEESIVTNEWELLRDLAHYSAYAHAVYGWKFGLLSGRLHLGDLAMLLRKTGLKRHDIIHANWKSKTHLPAHFLVRDVTRKTIVLCIRGTLSPKDVLTDLCCTAEDFTSHEEEMRKTTKYKTSRAHHGMLESARGVAEMTRKLIATELAAQTDYDLIIVGHSLGGGVAAILASLWRETFPGLKVYAYGCPCVGPVNFEPAMSKSIVSVVGEGDPFSCLSLGHLADASLTLSTLCKDRELRESILDNTKGEPNDLDADKLKWCMNTMNSLRKDMKAEKFYPPGRVLYMRGDLFGDIDDVTLDEVHQESIFGALRWNPRMFDLSLHIPHRYEVLLSRMWEKAKLRNKI